MTDRPYLLLRVAAFPFGTLESLVPGEAAERASRWADLETRLEDEADDLAKALYRAAGPKEPEAGLEAARVRLAVVALRRDVHNRRPVSSETRATALPKLGEELAERVDSWAVLRDEVDRLEAATEDVLLRELAASRRRLLDQVRQPFFAAALRLASRALHAQLDTLGRPATWRHDERLAAASLTAYLDRAATKTSPHGLFCATAPAGWAKQDRSAGVGGENRLDRRDALLHVTEARKVAATVGSRRDAWSALVPRVNPTLRETEDGAWQFWRPASLAREDDEEILRRMPVHPVAQAFLEQMGDGLAVPELIRSVADDSGVSEEDLADFFAKLQEAGLVSSEIEVPYTCRRPLRYVAQRVAEAGLDPVWLDEARVVEETVAEIGQRPPQALPGVVDDLSTCLDALPHVRPLETDELVRVDAASEMDVILPPSILADLEATLSQYVRLYASLYPARELRRGLARSFVEEHGSDLDIPLLDVYRGASGRNLGPKARPSGFPSPPTRETSGDFKRIREAFAQRAREAHEAGVSQVELTDGDFDAWTGGGSEPPWTAGVLFQVVAPSVEALAAGDYRLVVNELFTGAGLSLARFAFLHGNAVVDELRRSVGRLDREGAIPAEVTFNHWGRAANAGLRVPFLEHEIELLGELASPGKTVIPWSELVLRWDTRDDRFVLTWPEQDVEVVPVISSGVSPEGFISLLVAVGRQAIQPLSWFPGFETEGVTRWPRFVHGRTVLFRRRWTFGPEQVPEPSTETGDPDRLLAAFFLTLQRFRSRHHLPRHVFVHTDRETKPQHVDFSSPLDADRLRRLLATDDDGARPILYVTEMLPGPDEMWVRDGQGRYAAEFLVQLGGPVKETGETPAAPVDPPPTAT